MVIAHCTRCLGKAQGETFEVASSKINHAVSLSRGIPCGDNYNCVEEVKDKSTKVSTPKQSGQDTVTINEPTNNSSKTTSSKKSKKQY